MHYKNSVNKKNTLKKTTHIKNTILDLGKIYGEDLYITL